MATVRSIPEGYHSVTPSIVVKDGSKAIEFYKRAFNAKLVERMDSPEGKLMHAVIQIGDSRVMLGQENSQTGCQAPSSQNAKCGSLYLYVEDVDALYSQAVRAGAKVEMPLEDQFWGDRAGLLTDDSGNRWFLATHKKDLTPEQIKQAAEEFFAAKAR